MKRERLQKIQEQLGELDAYHASGQRAKRWAQDRGLSLGVLSSWLSHEKRWRELLEDEGGERPGIEFFRMRRESCDVAAHEHIRVEVGGVMLHWPLNRYEHLCEWLRCWGAR